MRPIFKVSAWLGLAALASGLILWRERYQLAVLFSPKGAPRADVTENSKRGKSALWDAFVAADYDRLPGVSELLTIAYVENPSRPETALLLGLSHLWRSSERFRIDPTPVSSIDELALAEKYLENALRLDPTDHRIHGWLGSAKVALGAIHADERQLRSGHAMLMEGIRLYPEYNYFSAAYAYSVLPVGHPLFRDAVDYAWKNIDVCIGSKIDRTDPDMRPHMAKFVSEGRKRVCWNSPKAPHAFEGRYLNMGDILAKSGNYPVARKIYEAARLVDSYPEWKLRPVLESRIRLMDERLRSPASREPLPLFKNSRHSCTGCHVRSDL